MKTYKTHRDSMLAEDAERRGKPILEPGRPGDLKMILRVAQEQLSKVEREEPGDQGAVIKLAVVVHRALEMWLGLRPVDDDDR